MIGTGRLPVEVVVDKILLLNQFQYMYLHRATRLSLRCMLFQPRSRHRSALYVARQPGRRRTSREEACVRACATSSTTREGMHVSSNPHSNQLRSSFATCFLGQDQGAPRAGLMALKDRARCISGIREATIRPASNIWSYLLGSGYGLRTAWWNVIRLQTINQSWLAPLAVQSSARCHR